MVKKMISEIPEGGNLFSSNVNLMLCFRMIAAHVMELCTGITYIHVMYSK
jgi:hypothetical protein